ncbi:MAG TPA: bifunctional 2-polyprenyl-6-hydroxyphenol methylase/3-demethylubiquinol 3-O-methyltransferase UbiG, partial [Methylococcales bacterium]|nr:bifunctional 2-polyprenyl-6-hydroxyphenol methylase/3-demethylubiquinol 3-O-methyltransferase UbiG [Methylococcales bacterium]
GLAKAGSKVTGIDLSPELIDIADLHGLESGIKVDYKIISAEAFAQKNKAKFDYVTCMEMLEHVPDPSAIVTACAEMVKPGGYVFFSTLNRKPKAYLLAILGAEYLLNMLPKGTHDYKTFIKPSELTRWTRSADLEMRGMIGIEYNPLTRNFYLSKSVDVNYIVAYQRPK